MSKENQNLCNMWSINLYSKITKHLKLRIYSVGLTGNTAINRTKDLAVGTMVKFFKSPYTRKENLSM